MHHQNIFCLGDWGGGGGGGAATVPNDVVIHLPL